MRIVRTLSIACTSTIFLFNSCQPLQTLRSGFLTGRCVKAHRLQTNLYIDFGWFWRNDDNQNQINTDESSNSLKEGKGNLGGVSGVMDSIERYKKAQRIGKMTSSLSQDLSNTLVEGIGAGGKAKVTFDCQHRVVRTFLEVGYFDSSSTLEVNDALTNAIKDGYNKSKLLADQMTQDFYSQLQSGILDLNLSMSRKVDLANDVSRNKAKIDRLKASLNQDLASNAVEGYAENGKVKAVYDCRQRPISISLDDSYFEAAYLVDDVCDAVTTAMQDAYTKSTERVDEKMKNLFSELGLPSN